MKRRGLLNLPWKTLCVFLPPTTSQKLCQQAAMWVFLIKLFLMNISLFIFIVIFSMLNFKQSIHSLPVSVFLVSVAFFFQVYHFFKVLFILCMNPDLESLKPNGLWKICWTGETDYALSEIHARSCIRHASSQCAAIPIEDCGFAASLS